MKYFLLFLLSLPINLYADNECVDNQFNFALEIYGEVSDESYREMQDWCDMQEEKVEDEQLDG